MDIRRVHDQADCNYDNPLVCLCEERVNKPHEKDDEKSRLALLQVLALISPAAGLIMSDNADIQQLLATDVYDCDQLQNVFENIKTQSVIGMGFVDQEHVALVNQDCITVQVKVSYFMLDPNQFQVSRSVRMTINLAALGTLTRTGRALSTSGQS